MGRARDRVEGFLFLLPELHCGVRIDAGAGVVVVELGHIVEEVEGRQDVDLDVGGRDAHDDVRLHELLRATECDEFEGHICPHHVLEPCFC